MGFFGVFVFFFLLPNPICSAFSPAEKHSTERARTVFTVPKHDHRTRKDKRHMATVEEGEATEVRGEEMKVQRSRNGTQRERESKLFKKQQEKRKESDRENKQGKTREGSDSPRGTSRLHLSTLHRNEPGSLCTN